MRPLLLGAISALLVACGAPSEAPLYLPTPDDADTGGVLNCASDNPCLETWACAASSAEEMDPRCWAPDGSYTPGCGASTIPNALGNGYPLDCFPTVDVTAGICINGACVAKPPGVN